jgi:hypothetical protein
MPMMQTIWSTRNFGLADFEEFLRFPVISIPFPHTGAAIALAVLVASSIFLCEFMSAIAMRFPGIYSRQRIV